jgi:hypothetical protein
MGDLLGTNDGRHCHTRLHRFIEKDRIMKDKSFANTRRNMSEFGGAGIAVNGLMACLGDDGKSFGGKRYRSFLQKTMRSAVTEGSGVDGKRSFEAVASGYLLEGLELNKQDQFSSRFRASYGISVNADRNEAVLTVAGFSADSVVLRPSGGTEFVVKLYAGALSDIAHFATGGYKPVNPTLHGLVDVQATSLQPVSGANAGFTLTATLPGSPVLPSTAGLVVAVSIEFVKTVNGVSNLLMQGNCLRIIQVS